MTIDLAVLTQCTSVTDRQTDRQTDILVIAKDLVA